MTNPKTWLAVAADADTVRLLPMEGAGPDFFVKLADYERLRDALESIKRMADGRSHAWITADRALNGERAQSEPKDQWVCANFHMVGNEPTCPVCGMGRPETAA